MSQQPWGPQHEPQEWVQAREYTAEQQHRGHPQPARNRRPMLLVAGAVVIAAALVAGAWVLSRDDSKDTPADASGTSSASAAAPRAFTDLSSEDRIYVSVITKDYPELAGSPGGVADDGHRVCQRLDDGQEAASIKADLAARYGKMAGDHMVTTAVVHFCGQNMSKLLVK